LKSATCTTEVMVMKAPAGDVDLRCGGKAMLDIKDGGGGESVHPDFATGTQLGKRYADAAGTLELLATKQGDGTLSLGEEPMGPLGAKSLPASD
jgi:hypothetical protein